MNKLMRQQVKKAKQREGKIQALSFSRVPGANKELRKMADNRHWYDRELKGQFLTGNCRGHSSVTILD